MGRIIEYFKCGSGKSRALALFCLVLAGFMLSGCGCDHSTMLPADCTEPSRCALCGKAEGYPLGHSWLKPDCVHPETCDLCGIERGEPKGHNWAEATENEPETCTRCGLTRGEPLPPEKEPLSFEQLYENALEIAREQLSDYEPAFELDEESKVLYISIGAPEGCTMSIINSPAGIEEYWSGMSRLLCACSGEIQDLFEDNGYDWDCCIMLMGDYNSENVLFAAFGGEVRYDVTEE